MPLQVVSTFSGCGGSSLGYKRAGCIVRLAIDFENYAVKTYEKNFDTPVWMEDIRNITGKKILDFLGMAKGELDILDGSPPCTPFSICGMREESWNKNYQHASESKSQVTDDLFFEYIRLIKELEPRAFVGENVRGLIMGKAKGYFNEILTKMKKLGYHVRVLDINAKDFEVPQSRPRIVYIGIRNDVFSGWPDLKTNPEISFSEAVKGLVQSKEDKKMNYQYRSYPKLWASMKHGQNMSDFHPKGWRFNSMKIDPAKPIHTYSTGSPGAFAHPYENRPISVKEVMRCFSYPDDFKFISKRDAIKRMGNSVPPNLMKHIALFIRKCLKSS